MTTEMHTEAWIPSVKGVYEPPPREKFPNVICRKIKISNHIDKRMNHFIGKDGKNFLEWTERFGVLYVFYREQHIEIWGENVEAVHRLIHFIIEKIKFINQKRQEFFDKRLMEEEQKTDS